MDKHHCTNKNTCWYGHPCKDGYCRFGHKRESKKKKQKHFARMGSSEIWADMLFGSYHQDKD